MMRTVLAAMMCVAMLAGCEDAAPTVQADAIPTGDPTKREDNEMLGLIYKNASMAAADGKFHWAQAAMSGYRNANKTDIPASFTMLPSSKCSLGKPEEGSLVRHVHIGTSHQNLPVHAFSKKDIASQAKYFIQRFIKEKGRYRLKVRYGRGGSSMNSVNVVVTETQAPVHLVLTARSKVAWNIQKAANATISGITLVGHSTQGIANVPEGVTVKAVTAKRLRKCKLNPYRIPRAHWRFVKNVGGLKSGDGTLQKHFKQSSLYSSWLRKTFGLRSTDTIDPYGISNVLIGPLPKTLAERVPFKPVAGATLMMMRDDHIFAGGDKIYRERFTKLVMSAATRVAGGDLKMLLN